LKSTGQASKSKVMGASGVKKVKPQWKENRMIHPSSFINKS
jgi:hypothetical protein